MLSIAIAFPLSFLVLLILDCVARLNGSDHQFLIVRCGFWPLINAVFDVGISCDTRKSIVLSLNEHVDECNLGMLQVEISSFFSLVFGFLLPLSPLPLLSSSAF